MLREVVAIGRSRFLTEAYIAKMTQFHRQYETLPSIFRRERVRGHPFPPARSHVDQIGINSVIGDPVVILILPRRQFSENSAPLAQ
jgi:hypothetical protein